MPNEQNLQLIQTTREARKKGRNGGIASGKTRREKRLVRDILIDIFQDEDFTKKVAIAGAKRDAVGLLKLVVEQQDRQSPQREITKDFTQFCIDAGYPKPYSQQITMKDYFFADKWTGQVKMLLGSRGIGKTDYITILGMAYEVYKNPKFTALIVTAEDRRTKDIIKTISYILRDNGVKLETDNTSSISVIGHIGKEPSFCGLSVGSKGFRGKHPNIVLFDDPAVPNKCSLADRKQLRVVYEEATKLAPKIAIIGQPVHKLDLYGELRGLVDTLECKYGTVPELDPDLDAQRAAGVSEESIQASYFLNLTDSDSVPFAKVEEAEYFPQGDTLAFIDPAIKETGKDLTAIVCGRLHFDGNFVCAGIAMRKPWEECLHEMKELFTLFNVKQWFFEDNVCGSEPVKRLLEITGLQGAGHTSHGKKHGRIMRIAIHKDSIKLHRIKTGNLIEQNRLFNKLVKEYEAGYEPDDPPDSLSSLLEKTGLLIPM